jgi:hypothetical protein
VNGRLTAAPEGETWSLNECTAAGRAAAQVGARAKPDAPPSRRGYLIAKTGIENGLSQGFLSGFRTYVFV